MSEKQPKTPVPPPPQTPDPTMTVHIRDGFGGSSPRSNTNSNKK